MSEWPCQGGEEGGGAGGAGQKLTLPLPPIQRSLHVENQSGGQQKQLRPAVFTKLEYLVREMQDAQHGVPVRSQKLFLTSIPAAFMGYDLIEWLMDRLCIEDSLEAVHLANLLCQFGYYFPVNEQKNLLVKDDSSLYRFQSPYYWPSQHHTPDNIEYAIYLYKRAQRRRNIHGLETGLPDYEMDALNNLKKILSGKWDFVTMQGEEQLRVAKDRKKGDKIINDSQEKAYWRVYRPPPGYLTLVEHSPVPTREQRVKARRNNKELLKDEVEFLKQYLNNSRVRCSQVAENLLDYTDTFVDYDPVLVGVGPCNPWMTDDISFWEINKPIPEVPTKKRVERWAISLEDTVSDPLGVQELLAFMKKEYSHENMRFWLAVQELKHGPGTESKIKKKVKEIWEEFLSPGAGAEINIDGKTMEGTKLAMKTPNRHTFDQAADHVYTLLLKKDCYPRFLRSEHYKTLLANSLNPGSSRKRFFNFPVRKKPSQNHSAAAGQPCSSAAVREPRELGIYGTDMGKDQDCGDQSFPSREFDEACPWDTEDRPPVPDVSRTRKVSIVGGQTSEFPFSKQKPETSVNESKKPGGQQSADLAPTLSTNSKTVSDERGGHVIKTKHVIGARDKQSTDDDDDDDEDEEEEEEDDDEDRDDEEEEDEDEDEDVEDEDEDEDQEDEDRRRDMEMDTKEESENQDFKEDLKKSNFGGGVQGRETVRHPSTRTPSPSCQENKFSGCKQQQQSCQKLSFCSSAVEAVMLDQDVLTQGSTAINNTTTTNPPPPPPAVETSDSYHRKISAEKKTRYAENPEQLSSAGEAGLTAVAPDLLSPGGQGSAALLIPSSMEAGDCWIAAEDVCPWEDDSLTPTWL